MSAMMGAIFRMGHQQWGVLIDLDQTLVETSALAELRSQRKWVQAYQALHLTTLFPGLQDVRNHPALSLGIVTTSPRPYAERLVAYHRYRIRVVVAYHDVSRQKPFPDPLLKAAEQLGIPVARCFHIGIDLMISSPPGAPRPSLSGYAGIRRSKITWPLFRHFLSVATGAQCSASLQAPCKHRSSKMKYDSVNLDRDVQWFQNLLSLALIRYIPQAYTSSSTKLILDFKEHQVLAREKVRDLALEALREHAELKAFRRGYLVALPAHEKGSINAPCEYLCAELAQAFPDQLWHLGWALRRTTSVAKSATAPPGARPTFADHYQSIRYAGPPIDCREQIIMVDAVLTRGATSRACYDILRQATGCKNVRGFLWQRQHISS
jgi:hypothetical protein